MGRLKWAIHQGPFLRRRKEHRSHTPPSNESICNVGCGAWVA